MANAWNNIKQIIRFLIRHAIFWVVLFMIERIIFISINSDIAIDAPKRYLLGALWHGLLFDASIIGYLTMFYCVVLAIASPFCHVSPTLRILNIITGVIASLVAILLPADAVVYSHWEHHFDATELGFLENPKLALASVDSITIAIYLVACIVLIFGTLSLLHKLTDKVRHQSFAKAETTLAKIVQSVVLLIVGGTMIIPIRGGVGIAPLNTGRAYFCDNMFANHTALNPLWNFLYSTKRLREATTTYHFMDDETAERKFGQLMTESGDYQHILRTDRPNIVFVLLESFSAHAIEFLGGENATPTIKQLLKESVAFNNVMAASDRSGKGLVAAMCGYPVLPTISIIQYPQKTQSLPFISKKLRENGYSNQTFVYGGDLNFNNFVSLVTIAGFDKIITQDDFSADQLGDKWGAHDEYAFDRLFEEIKNQKTPFFDFIFTLSSHEPFTVPMERKIDNDYLNSVYYTDKCLGDFIKKLKDNNLWDNTLLILMADHGHPGPMNVGVTDRKRFNIPLILSGGALTMQDTIIGKYGTQIDVASTLLHQLNIDAEEFTFSKNLLDSSSDGFSFFDFNDGFGYVDKDTYQVYDNQARKYLRNDTNSSDTTTYDNGMAILQLMSNDNAKR